MRVTRRVVSDDWIALVQLLTSLTQGSPGRRTHTKDTHTHTDEAQAHTKPLSTAELCLAAMRETLASESGRSIHSSEALPRCDAVRDCTG